MDVNYLVIHLIIWHILFVSISGYGLTGNPGTVSIYEDENNVVTVWAISGTCRKVERECRGWNIFSFCILGYTDVTYSESCNSCSYSGNTNNFQMDGMTLKKKACSDTSCGFQTACTASGCLNYGTDYSLSVSCTYNSNPAETGTVYVTVTENTTPSITSGSIGYATGTMSTGTSVYQLAASNHDTTYMKTDVGTSYRHSTSQLFTYHTGSLQIRVNKALSTEYSQYLYMELCARDRRDEDCKSITIKLTSCYDIPTCNDYNSVTAGDSFFDTHEINEILTRVTGPAPDSDFDDWSSSWPGLSYSLTDKGDLTMSTVDESTGVITTTANITVYPYYEYKDFTVTNTISNTGSCTTTTCTLTFRIYFKNWPIEILSLPSTPTTSGSLHEDHDDEKLIHSIITYDYNNHLHDNVTCVMTSVTPTDTGLFEVRTNNQYDYNSFFLWKKECLAAHKLCGFQCDVNSGCFNYDTRTSYDIVITCNDGYGSTDSGTFTLNVNVNQPQVFTNLPNTISLDSDHTAENDIIYSITYTDAENEILYFNYTFSPSTQYFSGSPSSNYHNNLCNITLTTYHWTVTVSTTYTIYICSTERRNLVCSYLYVKIEDRCGPDPLCSDITNTVTDQFAADGTVFTISPSNAGPFTSLSYSIASLTTGLFSIDSSSGVVKTLASFSLAGEDVTYYLNGYIFDSQACRFGVCMLSLTVTFTNHAPVLNNLPATGTSVPEDTTAMTSVFQISVSESDTGDSVTCAVVEASSSPVNNGKFFTRETYTGSEVWNVWCRDNPGLDYSVAQFYTVNIQCTDTHGVSVSGDLTVNIIENSQQTLVGIVAADGLTISINPANYVAGNTIYTVVTSDNEGDALTFTYTVVNSMTPLSCTSGGVVMLTRTLTVLGTDQVYTITITVTDSVHGYTITFTLTVTFTATNTRPVFDALPTGLTFAENVVSGTILHTVLVTDPDVGDTHTFSMTVAPSAYSSLFTLQETSYTMSATLTLATGKNFDYETQTTFKFIFYVSDQSNRSDRPGDLTIDVTNINEAPVLTLTTTTLTIDEGASGTIVAQVTSTCTDVDAGSTLTTSLSGTYSSYFSIASSGALTYAATWDLESGQPTSTTLTVTCTDEGGLTSSSGVLAITVRPVNEFSPVPSVTSASITLTPSTLITDVLLAISATDADYGDDGVFSYSILGIGVGSETFTMTSAGELKLIEKINLNYNKNFSFTIMVSDGETSFLYSGVSVFAKYFTDYTPETPKRPTYCTTCTVQGRAVVAVMAIEGVVILIIVVHVIVHFVRAHCFQNHVGNPTNVANQHIRMVNLNSQQNRSHPDTNDERREDRNIETDTSDDDDDDDDESEEIADTDSKSEHSVDVSQALPEAMYDFQFPSPPGSEPPGGRLTYAGRVIHF